MEFAKRMLKLKESETFKYAAIAKNKEVIDLTIGRTNFDVPKKIKDAAKVAIDSGKNKYTNSKGISELREKIAEKLRNENKISVSSENVIVSTGAKQIIFEAVMALIDNNDVVAIPDPSWVSYEQIVNFSNGRVIHPPLKFENKFIPDEEFLSYLENEKFKMLILNSPNNPTGAVYSEKVIKKIVDIAERKDAWLLSDEIYEKIIYEGKHFSPGSMYEKCITVNGFSKEASVTGWRIGYGVCKIKGVIDKMNIIQQQTVSCAPSVFQYAALEAFKNEVREEFKEQVNELKERRNFLFNKLKKFSKVAKPDGAFYIFPNFGMDDIALTEKLLVNGICVVPGSSFGSNGKKCLRISYGAVTMRELQKAVEIFERVINENDN
ncbi:MAG: pyridoxal phosphate-dependent aminotransferase [Candidatus Altiarchaeota archaeon]